MLKIDDAEAERLVAELCRATGESRTEAIRHALRERLALIDSAGARRARIIRWLEEDVWPRIPDGQIGQRLSLEAEAEILGYGPDGV